MRSQIRMLLFAIVCLAAMSQSAFSNTLYFPQVAFGGGFSTTFTLTNTGTTRISSTLTFYAQNGGLRTDLNRVVDLEAGASTRITLPNAGSGISVVWAELVAGSGTVRGVATFDVREGGALTSTAGVLGVEGASSFLLPVDVAANGTVDTGVAFGNNTPFPQSVSLRLIREDGVQQAIDNQRFGTFNPRAQAADFVTNWFPEIKGTAFRGTLVVEVLGGGTPLAATALTVKEAILSALPVIPNTNLGSPGRTIYFPQVAFGGGYSTTVTIMNTGSTAINSVLAFYAQDGTPRFDLSQTLQIPVGGSRRVTLPNLAGGINVVWGEFSPGTGTARGVAAFDIREGAALTATAGVLGLEAANSFNLPIDINASGSTSTGVAVGNASGTILTANFKLIREDGVIFAPSSALPLTFVPRQQLADFIDATTWFPQLRGTDFKGILVIDATGTAPPNSMVATALTVKEGILSALPVNAGSINGTPGGGGGGGGTGGGGGGGTGGGGGGGGTGGPASQCLHPNFASVNTIVMNHAFSGSVTGTATINSTHNQNVTFQGQTVSELVSTQNATFTAPFPISTTTTGKSYLRQEGNEIVNFGGIAETTTPIVSTSTSVNNPPYRERKYTLSPGESITQTQTLTSTQVINGTPLPPTNSTNTTSTKYVGQESVTVPAGTFNTCKFEVTQVSGAQAGQLVLTSWEMVGGTITIKSVSPDGAGGNLTLSLTSASINGSPVN